MTRKERLNLIGKKCIMNHYGTMKKVIIHDAREYKGKIRVLIAPLLSSKVTWSYLNNIELS